MSISVLNHLKNRSIDKGNISASSVQKQEAIIQPKKLTKMQIPTEKKN